MRLLLDTHIFLWYISGDDRLPSDWLNTIRNSQNRVYLSVVSIWEALVKARLGKLPMPDSAERYLAEQRVRHEIQSLVLDEASVYRLKALPDVHRNPYDRMLVCQALEHELTIVTVDPLLESYPAATLERG
jgi:PIN domain nuclease of toxin-antitoxin system